MKEKTDGLTMSQLAERNAEYVTTIAELEARCAALAAENAGLKAAIDEHSQCFTVCKCCGTENDCSHDDICRALNETPATDAFLAEMRAQGADTVAAYHAEREEALREIAPFASRDHKNARINAMNIAEQIRQEANID